jgi:hypothetical protein
MKAVEIAVVFDYISFMAKKDNNSPDGTAALALASSTAT